MRHLIQALLLNRRKPKSRLHRYTEYSVSAITLLWLALLIFPEPLFAYSVKIGQFEIQSDRPIPDHIKIIVERAVGRLRTSPLYRESRQFDIFIANDPWRRAILNPRAYSAFGVSYPWIGNVIVSAADVENDLCRNGQSRWNTRSLHGVIAHECTHQLIADRLGVIGYLRLARWKNEGYCDYVAGGGSFDHNRGLQLLKAGESDHSLAFRYFTYAFATADVLENRKRTVDQFLIENLDFDDVLAVATMRLRGEQPPEVPLTAHD